MLFCIDKEKERSMRACIKRLEKNHLLNSLRQFIFCKEKIFLLIWIEHRQATINDRLSDQSIYES